MSTEHPIAVRHAGVGPVDGGGRLRPEARALALIGQRALPYLMTALTREESGVRIQILLALMQSANCPPARELQDLAVGDTSFTVRCLARELL
jgi:hypothetical protein